MFKFVVLLSATLAFAAASYKVSPDTLHKIFNFVETEVTRRQAEAELEIKATTAPLRALAKEVRTRIEREMSEASVEYIQKIRELQKQAREEHEDITRCIDLGVYRTERLHNSTLKAHQENVERLEAEAIRVVESSLEFTDSALKELKELKAKVTACSTTECSNPLETHVIEFYDRAIIGLDRAVINANNAALIKLPLDLDEDNINKKRFVLATEKILQDVIDCAHLD